MATRADSLPPFIATPPVPTPRLAEFANDNVATDASSPFDTAWRRYASALPTDAFAIIEPDPLAGRSGGRARGRARLSIRSPAGREEATPSPIWSSASLRVKPPRPIAGGTASPTRAGAHREGRDLGHGARWFSSRSACLPAACLRVLIPCAAATRRRSRSRLPMRTPEQGLPSRR
jgi:hypothetical protein